MMMPDLGLRTSFESIKLLMCLYSRASSWQINGFLPENLRNRSVAMSHTGEKSIDTLREVCYIEPKSEEHYLSRRGSVSRGKEDP